MPSMVLAGRALLPIVDNCGGSYNPSIPVCFTC
jgi:hypothetical protein